MQAGQLSLVSFPREGVVLLCAASEEPAGDFGLVAAAEWWNRVTRAKVCLLLPNTWRKSAAVNRLATIQLDLTLAPPSALHSFPAPVRVHASPLPGMPHPASAGEQILYHRVRKDAELAVCLSFNQTITVDLDQNFRVDILCRSRRVAFEVDGRDHRTVAKYIADCERDFRLSVQGYVVIRLPEELVQADPEMAMERIRRTLRSRAEV